MKNITVILTLTGLLFSCGLYSQTDTSFVVGDTMIEKSFYKNGQLAHLVKFVKGRDIHSYHFSFWYYDNGNPKWLTYWDTFIDSSFYISGRKNGSIKRKDINSKHNWENIEQNKSSVIIKRSYGQRNDTFYVDETYKHGQLVVSTPKIETG